MWVTNFIGRAPFSENKVFCGRPVTVNVCAVAQLGAPLDRTTDLDVIRQQGILSSLAGFSFLLVMGLAWIAAAALSYFVPIGFAPWLYPCLGGLTMPIAIALDRKLGYIAAPTPDPLLPLSLQLLFVQIAAFPAVLLVWDSMPNYMPVAFAGIVGAHFLPFQWIYKTKVYCALGIVVAVGPYILAVLVGPQVVHFTGFLVGTALLIGAFLVRSHAAATWLALRQAAQSSDWPESPIRPQ